VRSPIDGLLKQCPKVLTVSKPAICWEVPRMARVADGRFTAQRDAPFVVFISGCGFRTTNSRAPIAYSSRSPRLEVAA
jgi:hypothetical protein